MMSGSEMRKISVRDLALCPFLNDEFGCCTLPDGPNESGECSTESGIQFPDNCPLKSEGAIVVYWAPLLNVGQPSPVLEGSPV